LRADKREGNGSECMVDMWEGRGIVKVPLRSCQVPKDAVQVHFRAFSVWIPTNSPSRVTNTVWWFTKPMKPSQDLLQLDPNIAYPPTRDRPNPSDDGSDLLGRHFLEPELGVCYITGLGPILHKVISTRAERNQQNLTGSDPTIPTGAHYTLFYRQKLTDAEHVSSITEILYWI
jgi:hypothetical protein